MSTSVVAPPCLVSGGSLQDSQGNTNWLRILKSNLLLFKNQSFPHVSSVHIKFTAPKCQSSNAIPSP